MNSEKVLNSITIAREFLAQADIVMANSNEYFGNKHTARLRRLSMELTRALAELRRPL